MRSYHYVNEFKNEKIDLERTRLLMVSLKKNRMLCLETIKNSLLNLIAPMQLSNVVSS